MKSARCARSKVSSRFTRPSRPTSFRAHNHQLKRATGVRDTSSNAGRRARVLPFVPASAYRRTVWAVVWVSPSVPSSSPVVAAARLALARSQRLAALASHIVRLFNERCTSLAAGQRRSALG